MTTLWRAVGYAAMAGAFLSASPAIAQRSIPDQADHRIKRADQNGNGTKSLAEFQAERLKNAANKPEWGPEMSDPVRIERAFKRFDADGNGEIDRTEIIAVLESRASN